MGPQLEEKCREHFPHPSLHINQSYGMTEMAPLSHSLPITDKPKPGSIGKLFPSMLCKIVDENGITLGYNQRGELCLKGPNVTPGYYNNPEATRNTIDDSGFLHTGDIGYIDEDGYYYIVDRAKELIKVNGMQVAPAELEAILIGHPLIADAAVIGVADDMTGEIPKAFVILKIDAKLQASEILEYVNKQVVKYKNIKEVTFVTQIPKLPSGKILRRLLRDNYVLKSKL